MTEDSGLHNEVRRIYGRLDADVKNAGPVCEISGRCCRFGEYGHRLYLSRPEAEILFHEGLPDDAEISEETCPFQSGNVCTAREKRPLGCRVYFCEPTYQDRCIELSEQYIGELKQLHQAHERDWEYAPLHVFAREAADRQNAVETP